MTFLKTIAVAFSTYSALPMPQFPWEERNMRYAICAFPLVGVICGGALLLWSWICRSLGGSSVLFAAVAVCLPLLLTGGIHMDGFMDTVDALASHQSRERKLEIMKDSACGAFAAIYCGVYLLLSVGLYHQIGSVGWDCGLIFILSRCLSGLCAVTMPNARKAGMLQAFTEQVHKKRAIAILLILLLPAAAAMMVFAPVSLVLGLLTFLWYRRLAMKQFGGVTGDTSGFFLQVCELVMLLGLWLGGLL